ncbi:MAG: 50S ribosomal protein L15 [Gammaproteobacteria bacterium]|nr:50S ribosomal protein L15 [Gammaproteobacteria bacterium]
MSDAPTDNADLGNEPVSARLNTLAPAAGSKHAKKRVGRGIAAGGGKTAGRGHKGQRSRSGGNVRPGFEGGQLPLQKRVPAFGFRSRIGGKTAEVRTSELAAAAEAGDGVVDLDALKAANIVAKNITRARVFHSGAVTAAVAVKGLGVSKGAREAIEKAGGRVEE